MRRFPIGVGLNSQHTYVGAHRRRPNGVRGTRRLGMHGCRESASYCRACGRYLILETERLRGRCIECTPWASLSFSERQRIRESGWGWGRPPERQDRRRVCSDHECDVVLSVYNPNRFCALHILRRRLPQRSPEFPYAEMEELQW